MTSKLTREQLRERAQLKAKNLASAISQSAFASCRRELEEELQFLQCALACMEDEPVEPIWGAKKYPVCRPVPGAKLIVWDETGKFVGYGSSVNTRESGVAIQISDGRRLDSNHDLRWQYALQPVPAMDSEPVAWLAIYHGEVYDEAIGITRSVVEAQADHFGWESALTEIIPLYRHAQPAPEKYNIGDATMRHIFTPTGMTNVSDMQAVFDRVEAVLVGMNQPAPVVPDGYVMVPMRLTAENGAKGALSGEFSETKFVNCPECFGADECETCDGSGRIEIKVPVSWTTIKDIWIKGVEHFAAAPQENN